MPPEILRRQALGRVFSLGALYDAQRDVFVSDPTLCDSFSPEALSVDRQQKCFAKHTSCEDSFTSRCDLLDVEANLRANLLLFDTGVSGEFLLRSSRSHETVTAALSVCLKTGEKTLLEATKNLRLDEKAPVDERATHVVVGVELGARAIVELSTAASDFRQAHIIRKKLGSKVALAARNLNESVLQTDINDDFFDAFEFEVYGDVLVQSKKPQSINEAMHFLREIPKLVGTEKEIPLSYQLLPLSFGKDITQNPSLLDVKSASGIADCYNDLQRHGKAQTKRLHEAEELICYLVKDAADEITDLLKERERNVNQFCCEMKKMVLELISGEKSKKDLDTALNEWSSKVSKPQKALPWLANVLVVHKFLRRNEIEVLKCSEQLENILSRSKLAVRDVYVLFTVLDPFKVTLDSFKSMHEDFIKLNQDERHIADFVLIDTNAHLKHQDSTGTEHYCYVNSVFATGHSDISTTDTGQKPFLFRCPGLNCSPDLLAWKCSKCYKQVTKKESFLYCSCGSIKETECSFKCSHENHGSEYQVVESGGVERFCQMCEQHGDTNAAEFVCYECEDYQYYCEECAQFFHEEDEKEHHTYRELFPSSPQVESDNASQENEPDFIQDITEAETEKNLEEKTRAGVETCIANWEQLQYDECSKEVFYSFMVGKPQMNAMQLSAVNLENLLDDENSEKFLEGSAAFGQCTVERLRKAVEDSKNKHVGLITSLLTFLIDSLIRRERLSTFTELFCGYHMRDDSDVPEMVLDLTTKDVAIALLETVPNYIKLFVMKRLDSMGYPLPLCYVTKQWNEPSTCIDNFGVLSSVLPGSTCPLIMSCGTFNTVGLGKTSLLKELICKWSTSIDTDLLDDSNGPTHNPSIDLILEKEEKGDFSYVDIHGWNADPKFADVVATLASVSYLILLHVSEDDVKDLKSQELSAVKFILKEQLRSAKAVLVVLIRDTEDETLRVEAEAEFRKAFPSGREVVSILVKNLKSEKGSRLDRVITIVSQRLEKIFNAPQEKELREEKLRCPPSEYLAEIYRAKRYYLTPPCLRLRTSLGQALMKALTSTYKEKKGLFSKLFPLTTIKSKIAETHANEKEIIEGLAKNKPKHERYIKECEDERERLKMERLQIFDVAEPLKLFADVIRSKDAKGFAEFQYYLEEWKSKHVDSLYKRRQRLHDEIKRLRMKQDSREESDRMLQAQQEYQENSSALDEIDVSVDSFWSEIMHMYNLEAKNKSKQLTSCCALAPTTVKNAYLDYLKQGFAMQLLQGKPLQMAGQFMRDILSELDRQESSEGEKDLFVVSVIGEQSSGKSTLLNSLFGCGFSTAAGKCTKGLFASYLKLSTNKSLLVLDSEGLLSIEGGGRVFDGQITLLALACSDLVIINHKGEISSELNDLLQVCLYAMDTLKVAKIKPNVTFVLRDQRDCRKERVHQTALLKMQEAIRKAVSTSSKDVDDLIEIGSDSLFLLHSAFSETTSGTRSIEIPSLKFSRETFRLRKKIIQFLETGNVVHTALKKGSTSRPLSDWYKHASYVWKTVTKHGHSLLYCKTVQEIRIRQELGILANEVVKKELDDESRGFKMLARLSFDKFLDELNRAETEKTIDRVGRNFDGELEAIMASAVEGLQQQFDQMTTGKQYQEFKTSFKNSLSVPVRHEYNFQKEKWKMKEDHRKQELHLKVMSEFFLERTNKLLKSRKFQRGISTEEAKDLFKKQWEEFEPKAMARLGVKKSVEEIRTEVYRLFSLVAESTKVKVAERFCSVTTCMPDTKLSKQNGLPSRDQDWTKYVGRSRFSRLVGIFSSSAKEIVETELKHIRANAEGVVSNLKASLTGSSVQPFSRKLVKATVDEAVSVSEKAESGFNSKDGLQFLTIQFMTDFVITVVNESVASLVVQQEIKKERAKEKLLEDKDNQRRYFLAIVSEDKTDLDKAEALAKLYETALNLFIDAELDDLKATLHENVANVFGHDHKETASRAYQESFKQKDFENVVMYCIDANRFLYSIYASRFEEESDKLERVKGKQLITKVDKAYTLLVQACQNWQKEVTKSKWLASLARPKLSDFGKWLKESSGISQACLRNFPELSDYTMGRYEVLFPKLSQELEGIQSKIVQMLEKKVRDTLYNQKRYLWMTQLRGCPRVCPKCGVKCEGESNHTGSHTVTKKLHMFPSFHRWWTRKDEKKYTALKMCLDPEVRKQRHIHDDRIWNNLDGYLKDEHPDWQDALISDPSFAEPRSEIKEAWVNCRRALIHLIRSEIIDDTPQDWIETYTIKGKAVTEHDVERLRRKLKEVV